MLQEQQENANKKGVINKIKRENKCIPDLIFQIEDCEKHLIQLSKLSKINLLRHAKRSTSRDFKILDPVREEENPDAGHEGDDNEAAEAEGESSEHDEENGLEDIPSPTAVEDSENEDDAATAKRFKRSKVVQDSDDEA